MQAMRRGPQLKENETEREREGDERTNIVVVFAPVVVLGGWWAEVGEQLMLWWWVE